MIKEVDVSRGRSNKTLAGIRICVLCGRFFYVIYQVETDQSDCFITSYIL